MDIKYTQACVENTDIKFTIASKHEAEIFFSDRVGFFSHIISMGNPEEDLTKDTNKPKGLDDQLGRVLRLKFHDITKSFAGIIAGYKEPQKEHVRAIIDFAKGIESGNVLIHCDAGISRSSAAALICLCVLTKDEKKSVDLMYQARSKGMRSMLHPNKLMLQYADAILDSNLKFSFDGATQTID